MEKVRRLSINRKYFVAYGVILGVLLQIKPALGRYAEFILLVLLLFPVISTVYTICTFVFLRFSEHFSTDHPVKGDEIVYTLSLANESIIPLPTTTFTFFTEGPAGKALFEDMTLNLRMKQKMKKSLTFSCAFRGIYKMGMRFYSLHDLSLLYVLRIPAYFRTFYVYPRIIEILSFPVFQEEDAYSDESAAVGRTKDVAYFRELRPYRRNEPLKHLYWKKFAAYGKPLIKEYETTGEPNIAIYFDTRRESGEKTDLEREDATVEILIALVCYFLKRHLPVVVKSPGEHRFDFSGDNFEHFQRFYEQTVHIQFREGISPAQLYHSESIDMQMVIFITHRIDAEIFSLLQKGGSRSILTVLNQVNVPAETLSRRRKYFEELRHRGCRLVTVDSSETIQHDLSRCSVKNTGG
ncbi:MAG: DUF58 domain-containing protein [Spirochaetales bacterium]|nr:DUF58 domain-containing protein [Spirochaetales bacterium]